MRTVITSLLLLLIFSAKAQMYMPASLFGFQHNLTLQPDKIAANKKWQLYRYSGLTTGFSFFNGGSAAVFSVPFGIQLNRQLSNNWIAFANVNAAPSFINFNHSFVNNNFSKTGINNFTQGSNFNIYSSASMGLMYINNDKTFSISGSISVERTGNPLLPAFQSYTPATIPARLTNKY